MSPINAMERSYGPLKQLLRAGVFPAGSRLEANRLAYELGVSMTPVRDALHCLTGEKLVEASLGEGFRVPRLSEAELRDLYEWNAALMSIASRTVDVRSALAGPASAATVADTMSAIVARIADIVPNGEVGAALVNANDRLHAFRIIEEEFFDDVAGELNELRQTKAGVASVIRRYHLRRMKAVAEILRRRDHR